MAQSKALKPYFESKQAVWSLSSKWLVLFFSFIFFSLQTSQVVAAQQCSAIFTATIENATIKELPPQLERLQRILKETDLNPVGQDRLTLAYAKSIQNALESIQSSGELLNLFNALAKLKAPDTALNSTLYSMDLLQPLRDGKISWSAQDTLQLKTILQRDAQSTKILAGDSIQQALDIILDPNHARSTVASLLNFEGPLAFQFLQSSYLHRSLLNSLITLPDGIRSEVLQTVINARLERQAEFRAKRFAKHQDEIDAKHALRNTQYLQSLLLQKEFKNTLANLNQIYKKSGTSPEFWSSLEGYLKLLRVDANPYAMNTVIQAAQTIRKNMGTSFEARDTIEMFGSFPNLNARLGASDIDLMLTGYPGTLVRTFILNGSSTASGLTAAELPHISKSAQPLAKDLVQIERQLQKTMNLPQEQGALLGLTTLQAWARTPEATEALSDRRLRDYAIYGPVTIHISKSSIRLRIHDSLSPTPGMASIIHEFEIK